MQTSFDPQAELAFVRAYLEHRDSVTEQFAERMKCVPRILAALNARMGCPLDEHDLADLAQETTLLILQKLDQFTARASLESWVYKICALELMNGVRRKRRQRDRVASLDGSSGEPESAAPARHDHDEVHRALDRLGHDAEVVRLKHFDALTFDEIGARLRVSPNTAKTRYYRGLTKLAFYLSSAPTVPRERAAR